MRRVILVSLLLVSLFLIGNAEMALAQCMDYRSYECTHTEKQYGEITYMGTECVGLCYDDEFQVDVYGSCFECYLYPATDLKYLLGTADTCAGWSGCSVEFKGRSIIVNVTNVQDDNGYEHLYKCTPTNVGCY